jgi:hypothetical protein
MKMTKQGVRDLNDLPRNKPQDRTGHKQPKSYCKHPFQGQRTRVSGHIECTACDTVIGFDKEYDLVDPLENDERWVSSRRGPASKTAALSESKP